MTHKIFAGIVLISILLAACASPAPTPTPTPVPPTATATATSTPPPTATATAIPPTATPVPSPTPSESQAAIARGNAAVFTGNFDQAIAEFSKVIELDPNSPEVYYLRGNSYRLKGSYYVRLALRAGFSTTQDFFRMITDLNKQEDSFDRAIADLTKAIELNPNWAGAYSLRGDAYRLKGNAHYNKGITKGIFDQAFADYSKALELDPKLVDAYFGRALVYIDQGSFPLVNINAANYDQAATDLTKAIELDPKNADAYYYRGIAYRQQGLKTQAITDFQMYPTLNPNASDRAQVEQWLRELKGQ